MLICFVYSRGFPILVFLKMKSPVSPVCSLRQSLHRKTLTFKSEKNGQQSGNIYRPTIRGLPSNCLIEIKFEFWNKLLFNETWKRTVLSLRERKFLGEWANLYRVCIVFKIIINLIQSSQSLSGAQKWFGAKTNDRWPTVDHTFAKRGYRTIGRITWKSIQATYLRSIFTWWSRKFNIWRFFRFTVGVQWTGAAGNKSVLRL